MPLSRCSSDRTPEVAPAELLCATTGAIPYGTARGATGRDAGRPAGPGAWTTLRTGDTGAATGPSRRGVNSAAAGTEGTAITPRSVVLGVTVGAGTGGPVGAGAAAMGGVVSKSQWRDVVSSDRAVSTGGGGGGLTPTFSGSGLAAVSKAGSCGSFTASSIDGDDGDGASGSSPAFVDCSVCSFFNESDVSEECKCVYECDRRTCVR